MNLLRRMKAAIFGKRAGEDSGIAPGASQSTRMDRVKETASAWWSAAKEEVADPLKRSRFEALLRESSADLARIAWGMHREIEGMRLKLEAEKQERLGWQRRTNAALVLCAVLVFSFAWHLWKT